MASPDEPNFYHGEILRQFAITKLLHFGEWSLVAVPAVTGHPSRPGTDTTTRTTKTCSTMIPCCRHLFTNRRMAPPVVDTCGNYDVNLVSYSFARWQRNCISTMGEITALVLCWRTCYCNHWVISLFGLVFRWDQRWDQTAQLWSQSWVQINQSRAAHITAHSIMSSLASSLISPYFFVYLWISKKWSDFRSSKLNL